MTPKQASTDSGVPLPRVYDTLRSLQAKGFVQERAEMFSAISARAALESRKSQFDLAFSKEQEERESAIHELSKIMGAHTPVDHR